jgi:3-hydroxyisobutyrate dehydrogenase-like beta-hydroxyacid dehydrogenase
MTERIGFIGAGLMGHGIARSLLHKGYSLTILAHRNRGPVDDLIKHGAEEAKSAAELAATSDIVILCVTGSNQVEAVVRGPDGLKAGGRPGVVIIDCSTSDPNSTLTLEAELKPLGIALCDAPLGGTPENAREGKLSVMVGCDASLWPRIEPLFAAFTVKATRLGPTGDGHKMKLIMNFLAMGYASIFAEALALGQKVGLNPQTIDSALRGSRMDSGFYQTFFRWVLARDSEAHKFTVSNAHKDMKYLAAMAEAAGIANPVGSAVKNYFALAQASGRGEDFVPMLADFVAALNGVVLSTPAGARRAE